MLNQTHPTPASLYVFDMDETLIAKDLSVLWHQHLVHDLHLADEAFLAEDEKMMADYYQGAMNLDGYVEFSMQPIKHLSTTEIDAIADTFIETTAARYVYPQAISLLQELHHQGKTCMIISATVTFLVKALAKHLDIEFAEGVNLHQENGFYTGKIFGVPSYQAGKVIRLKQWLESQNGEYMATHFYSDSINDLPLLLEVPNPIVVNGCPKLKEHAVQSGWQQLSWAL
ncbi:HAD family hydrolase [Vibrio agarivorans]|uniref:HAD family hydrolase n=1 Tax=Vibrio agarivorans TaxID=153622 RepID=A0ABT7Y0X1_9VIBR|nr:HAD family hydrolase [Vibrio agarivorans]MDN2481665.1 HAD family hydrolase [Vibrio agarivorans]